MSIITEAEKYLDYKAIMFPEPEGPDLIMQNLLKEIERRDVVIEAAKAVSEYKSGRIIKIPIEYSKLLFALFAELEALRQLEDK